MKKAGTGDIVSIEKPVGIGDGGSITVGNGDGDYDLYFGENSYTIVNASNLSREQAAITNTSGYPASVYVDTGAALYLENPKFGRNYIVAGYDTAGVMAGGWDDLNLSSNSDLILRLFHRGEYIWVQATPEDIRDMYPDIW